MYTLIFMSSRGDSVHQKTINQKQVLLFFIVFSALISAGIGGLGYGLFQKQQRVTSEKSLQISIEKLEELGHAKYQVESQLNTIDEEMNGIRQMTRQIQEILGIFGQGGMNVNMTWTSEESEKHTNLQQEHTYAIINTATEADEKQNPLTPSILKKEMQPLYDHVSEYQKQIDGHPSILPVKLEKADGEKYGFWYSSQFGSRIHPFTKKREFHQGLDIKTRAGVPVIAAANGTIVKAKRAGYLGKVVEITHDGFLFKTLYAHLKGYPEGLKVGQKVERGQVIGYVGNTGRSTGAHLHYGVYDIKQKKWVNPLEYIFDQQSVFSR